MSPNNKFSLQWISITNKKVGYSFGMKYSIENMPFGGKVILQEEKYEDIWMKNYQSSYVEMPLGLYIKVNKNIDKHTFLILEPSISFYTHEEYFYHESECYSCYTPSYSDPVVYETNYNKNKFEIGRLVLTVKFDRETKIGKRFVLSRGASLSFPSIFKIAESLQLSNLKVNGFIGIGYNL